MENCFVCASNHSRISLLHMYRNNMSTLTYVNVSSQIFSSELLFHLLFPIFFPYLSTSCFSLSQTALSLFPPFLFSFVSQINSPLLTLQTYSDDVNECNDYYSHQGLIMTRSKHVLHTHTCTHTVSSASNVCVFSFTLQILSNRKGLLPEPNLAQLLTSMTNPAALQILMRPYHTGKRGGMAVDGSIRVSINLFCTFSISA